MGQRRSSRSRRSGMGKVVVGLVLVGSLGTHGQREGRKQRGSRGGVGGAERRGRGGGFISAKARGVIEKCAALTGSAD